MERIFAPDYSGACVNNIVPALLQHRQIGDGWIPDEVLSSKQVVLLVIDGLGYNQYHRHRHLLPSLMDFSDHAISTVFPTTTATALTSITTGTTPGEHGVVGYKIRVGTQTLNALRWTTKAGPALQELDPSQFQPIVPFTGKSPTVISPASFVDSGFTHAHLRHSNYAGYWMASSIATEVSEALQRGEPFVYAYYDGLDMIGHLKGLGSHYQAELGLIDHIVSSIADVLPRDSSLVITADHGMVNTGNNLTEISKDVLNGVTGISGEARFVWLHVNENQIKDVAASALEAHGDIAWVFTCQELLDRGWFGKDVSDIAKARLGQVALVVHEDTALVPDVKTAPMLIARHGSVTDEERTVPLLSIKIS